MLVAVDGSENSGSALDFALDIAEKFNASIMVLNVSESLAMSAVPAETLPIADGNTDGLDKELRKVHDEILSRSVTHAKTVKPNLTISSMLTEGDPAQEIVNVAREGDFDVIVVGHRGLGRIKELVLGGVSEKVARLTPCPIIIVR
jgi:nucleotide-binding universal stress UspA family protein